MERYRKELTAAGLLSLRLGLGSMMIGAHGWSKLVGFADKADSFPDPLGIGSPASLTLTVFAEVFCSFLLIAGAGTRLAAVPLLIAMLTAGLIVHADDPFARKEKALLYAVGYIGLLMTGPGPWSVDAWLYPRMKDWWARRKAPPSGGA